MDPIFLSLDVVEFLDFNNGCNALWIGVKAKQSEIAGFLVLSK